MHRTHAAILAVFASLAIFLGGFCMPAIAGGLTFAHTFPEDSAVDRFAREYRDCVDRVGGLYVEIFPAGSLGRSRDIADGVLYGQIDMALVPTYALEKYWPALSALSIPGLVEDPRVLGEVSGEPELIERIEKTIEGKFLVRPLAIGWRPLVLVGTNAKLDDLNGAKVRTYDKATAILLQELGAESVRISSAEVFAALQYGVADGAIVSIDTARKLLKEGSISSIVLSDDFSPFAQPLMLFLSASAAEIFGSELPQKLRSECRGVSRDFNMEQVRQLKDLTEIAAESGVEIMTLDDSGRRKWRDAIENALQRSAVVDDPLAKEIHQLFREFTQ